MLAFIGYFWLSVSFPVNEGPLSRLTASFASLGHAHLWQDMLALVGDYRFTGAGLSDTAMILSTYVFLLHVPFLSHAHNLYLQIALEQGFPGLLAFLGLIIAALGQLWVVAQSRQRTELVWAVAAVASLSALMIHGIFDTELYVSRLVPMMFLPLAGAGLALTSVNQAHRDEWINESQFTMAAIGSLLPIAVLLALFFLPNAQAALQANLGAVRQTQTELAIYQWPDWPMQDVLRRDPNVDLAPAIDHYENALKLAQDNGTARRRLGQIALSRGDYAAAWTHLEVAHMTMPRNRITRQMLGEAYATLGDVENGVAFWQANDMQHERLIARHWWYEHIDAQAEAHYIAQVLDLLAVERKANQN